MEKKRNVVITGASRGIGSAIALKLAEQNFNTILFGRDGNRLTSLVKKINELGSKATYFTGDVADERFVEESFNIINKKFNRIEALVNNAGVAVFEKFVDSSLENFKRQIDTNLYGVYNFCKAAIGGMIDQNYGTIVNVVSLAGKAGFQYGTAYSSTKHAVMGFTKSLMLEVRKYNIRVIAVCPGSVKTEMIADSPIHQEIKEVLMPEDVAELVALAINLPLRALVSEIDIRPNNP